MVRKRCASRLWPAALAGSESGFLGLRGGVVELDVGAACQAGGTGWAAVDLGCQYSVDEAVDGWVAIGDGLPSLRRGESIGGRCEAGDLLWSVLRCHRG